MFSWLGRHPLIATALAVVIVDAPQWMASVWALYSNEPLFPWLAKHNFPTLAFSPWYVTAPAGAAMFGIILLAMRANRQRPRAEFSPIQARLNGDGIEEFKFAIAIKNVGDCAATEIHFRGFVWDEALRGDLKVLGDEIAHDIPVNICLEACFLSRISTLNTPPHFVVLTVEYKPNLKSPPIRQTFYFKFRGIKDGEFDRILIIATKSEKEAIERRFAEELKRAGLTP